jgi:hypothetical protein
MKTYFNLLLLLLLLLAIGGGEGSPVPSGRFTPGEDAADTL